MCVCVYANVWLPFSFLLSLARCAYRSLLTPYNLITKSRNKRKLNTYKKKRTKIQIARVKRFDHGIFSCCLRIDAIADTYLLDCVCIYSFEWAGAHWQRQSGEKKTGDGKRTFRADLAKLSVIRPAASKYPARLWWRFIWYFVFHFRHFCTNIFLRCRRYCIEIQTPP